MKKLFDNINKLMMGRYGVDSFNKFLIYGAFILSILRLFLRDPDLIRITSFFIWLFIGFSAFRVFSKNIEKRYQENVKFIKATKPLRAEIELLKLKIQNRGNVKYIKCPNCKTVVKVPANVGKIKIKCRKCKNEFIKRV